MWAGSYLFNVADFPWRSSRREGPLWRCAIIAGKDEQLSCVLSAKLTYLELNPFWRVPDSIATKEILPEVKKDPGYLERKNIKVFKDWSDNAKEIDPMKVKWSRINAGNLTHKFRQEPGLSNPLGWINSSS